MKWVRWSQWADGGMVNFGQMPLKDVEKNLAEFGREARKILNETGAAHVVYGVKDYDDAGELEEVRFYLKPMDEDEFDRVAAMKGVIVYAVHAMK